MTQNPGLALGALLTRIVRAPAPFYLARLRAAGVTEAEVANHAAASDVIARAVLERLPLTDREELLRDQLAQPPHGTRRCGDAMAPVRAGVTGTAETLLLLTWSAADLARERAAGTRVLARMGVAGGMRVANALPGALTTPGALLLGDVVEELGALDIPLGSIEAVAAARPAWEMIDRVRPEIVILDENSAAHLFAAVPEHPRDWWRGIVWLSRGTPADGAPALPAAAGFSGWQRTWLTIPEVASFVAGSCTASRFHVDEGVLVEIVDASSATGLPPGTEGIMALTALAGDTAVLRYNTNLRGRTLVGPCPCARGGVIIQLA